MEIQFLISVPVSISFPINSAAICRNLVFPISGRSEARHHNHTPQKISPVLLHAVPALSHPEVLIVKYPRDLFSACRIVLRGWAQKVAQKSHPRQASFLLKSTLIFHLNHPQKTQTETKAVAAMVADMTFETSIDCQSFATGRSRTDVPSVHSTQKNNFCHSISIQETARKQGVYDLAIPVTVTSPA